MNRRLFLKFSIFLSLMFFYNRNSNALINDSEIVIMDGWILKKGDFT